MNILISPDNKNNQLLSNDEFITQKNKLKKEKLRLECSLKNYNKSNSNLIEMTKEIFEFSRYARSWFKIGDNNQKRTIIKKLYRKHVITDGKVLMLLKKPFEIASKLQGSTNYIRTENFGLDKRKNTSLKGVVPIWQGWPELLGNLFIEMSKNREDY